MHNFMFWVYFDTLEVNFLTSTKQIIFGWFSRQQSKSAQDKKEETNEENKGNVVESSAPDVVDASSESDDEFFPTTSEQLSDEDETKSEVTDDPASESVKVGSSESRGTLEIFDSLVGGFRNRAQDE